MHLDYLADEALESALHAAADVGIERIVTIAVSADNLDTVQRIATDHDQVWCTQGIHPHEADSWSHELSARITESSSNPKVVAIGEIGLDYHYDHADRRAQAAAFDAQLNIASEAALPVVIHTREADERHTRDLSESQPGSEQKGVIHSFTAHYHSPSSA